MEPHATGRHHIEAIQIAHVQCLLRMDAGPLQGPMENAGIGLFDAHDVGIRDDAEVRCEACLFEDGREPAIGVRDDPQVVSLPPEVCQDFLGPRHHPAPPQVLAPVDFLQPLQHARRLFPPLDP